MTSSEFFVFPERYFKNFICILLSMISPVFDFLYKVSQKRGTGNSERRIYDEEHGSEGDERDAL